MNDTKNRIEEYGEVFTSEKEVSTMLDLVADETNRIDAKFLEPACGNGNFLIEVLRRKIQNVAEKYARSQPDFEKYSFIAISNIYGIDLLKDNIIECRNRLFEFFLSDYMSHQKFNINDDFLDALRFVLEKNIVQGDALSMNTVHSDEPIAFSDWSLVSGSRVKRTEYTLSNLLAYQPFQGDTLFSDLGESAFIPHVLKKHKIVNFWEVHHAD